MSLLYKYAKDTPVTGAYTPYRYLGNGKTEGYEGFDPGRDSYIIGSGLFPYVDFETGQERFAKVGTDSVSENLTHAIYFYGDHKFNKGLKFKYSMMYMHSKAALTMQYPISMSLYDTNTFGSPLYKAGSVTPYEGPIQMVASQYYPQVGINTFLAKAELTKKVDLHNLRLGMTYQYYNAPEKQHTGTYLQTVGNNPEILSFVPAYEGVTQTFTLGGTGGWKRSYTSKLALFASDDFTLNRWLSGGVGGRIELQNGKNHIYPYPNTNRADNPNAEDYVYKNKNKVNYVLTGNLLAKVTKQFGFVAEATYNRYYSSYLDYADNQKDPDTQQPIQNAIRNVENDHYESVLNLGGGVYWNIGSYLSLVSKVTYISKNDIVTSENVFDGATQYSVYPITYDINTLGWTTDIVSTFGDFNLHFLFTLQNPQYKNYDYSYKGTQYSYSDKVIPTLSKTLIEIDPSYYLFGRDVRVWASFRYFGKQYGNKPNTISYEGWWETFAGIDYHVNRYIDLKLKLCNVLNQKGVSGSLVGGEQITDESQMIGKGFVAENIRPRALEISASIKF